MIPKLKFLTEKWCYEQFGYFCHMKILGRLFDFYLDASVHVALSVLCLMDITAVFFGVALDIHIACFIFFGTIASYNFIKYGVEAEKYLLVANRYHKYIQFFSFIMLGLAGYHALYLSAQVWMLLGALSILIGLYALPVLPQARNLRSLGILKVLLVGFVWGGTTVMLPLLAARENLQWDAHIEATQRLLLVLVLMLPFEIRDLKYDKASLRTLPQRFGVTKTKILGSVLAAFFLGITFFEGSAQYDRDNK